MKSTANISTVFLELFLLSTFLLLPLFCSLLFCSLSSDIYHNHLYIFLCLYLSLVISSSLLPTLLSSTILHVQQLAHCGVTRLSSLLTPYFLAHIIFLLSTPILILSAIHCLSILLLLSSLSLLLL